MMSRLAVLPLVLTLAAVSIAGCRSEAEPDAEAVVATVDGLELTADAFRRSYLDFLVTTGQNDTPEARERHLDAMVDAFLLGAEAERRGLGTDSALVAAESLARRRLVGARYYESTVLDTMAAPTDEEVERAFRLGSEQRVVRQLYYTDPDEAAAAYARLRDGSSFVEEARTLYGTQDSSAGSLGAVSYWELDDAFAEAAFSTPVGEVSAPVQTRLGIHIIRVDDRLRNPLLTESELARRRRGVESQLRLRRRRLAGDAWVRAFMEGRDVQIDRDALAALTEAMQGLGELAPDAEQAVPVADRRISLVERREVLEALTPSTPLATFVIGGERQPFTVADYVSWLGALPPSEARSRPAASLGRALRNEALARAGEAAAVGDAPEVRAELARQRRLALADALRSELRAAAPPAADTLRLAGIGRDLQLTPRETVVDFWAMPFGSRAEAEAALPALRRAAGVPPGAEAYDEQPLAAVPAYAAAVRAAPLGVPTVAAVGEGWAVVRVGAREQREAGSAAEALLPFAAEADLLRELRRTRPVRLDESLRDALLRPPSVPARSR